MLDPARLVFLDETGAKTNMTRLHARSRRGTRAVDFTPQGHWHTITLVTGPGPERLPQPARRRRGRMTTPAATPPTVLLEHYLKQLKLPTVLCEYKPQAHQCALERTDYPVYLLRLPEREPLDREQRAAERRETSKK
jgi:hypothetical protein